MGMGREETMRLELGIYEHPLRANLSRRGLGRIARQFQYHPIGTKYVGHIFLLVRIEDMSHLLLARDEGIHLQHLQYVVVLVVNDLLLDDAILDVVGVDTQQAVDGYIALPTRVVQELATQHTYVQEDALVHGLYEYDHELALPSLTFEEGVKALLFYRSLALNHFVFFVHIPQQEVNFILLLQLLDINHEINSCFYIQLAVYNLIPVGSPLFLELVLSTLEPLNLR
jgi:hypothetical protein